MPDSRLPGRGFNPTTYPIAPRSWDHYCFRTCIRSPDGNRRTHAYVLVMSIGCKKSAKRDVEKVSHRSTHHALGWGVVTLFVARPLTISPRTSYMVQGTNSPDAGRSLQVRSKNTKRRLRRFLILVVVPYGFWHRAPDGDSARRIQQAYAGQVIDFQQKCSVCHTFGAGTLHLDFNPINPQSIPKRFGARR